MVVIMRASRNYHGHFADAVWGGRRLALIAAQRFRDGLLGRIEPDTRVRRRVPRRSKNETNVVGVIFEEYVVEGRTYQRYVANWKDPEGRYRRRRFSVGRYRKKGAFDRAVEERRRGVAHTRDVLLARQRSEASGRLAVLPAMPRMVKDPKSRRGIRMPPRDRDRREP